MSQTSAPHKRAAQVYAGQFGRVLAELLFQVFIRLLAFAPLIYGLLGGRFFRLDSAHAPAYGLLCSLPLYVLLVMPFRFQAAARKAQLYGLQRDSRINARNYLHWLGAALLRLLAALPFLILFWGFVFLFYYYMRMLPFNESLLAIHQLGQAVGGDYPAGIAIIGLAGLLSIILAACAWKRGLAFEHQDVLALGIRTARNQAAQLRKRRRRHINRTIFLNALLCLPAIIGVLAVLAIHLLGIPRVGMLALDFVNAAGVMLSFSFPSSTLLTAGLVLLVLWLPLLPLRKLALAAVLLEQP